MSTPENLKEAFAGESQANRKYLAYARKADEEGFSRVAKLFRAAADAETVHALAHLRVMKKIGSTEDNLKDAIEGETAEFTRMYPGFIEEAEKEGETEAASSFKFANEVEKIHASLFKKALEELGNEKPVDYYVCQYCGNTVEGDPPERCQICGAPKSMFKKID